MSRLQLLLLLVLLAESAAIVVLSAQTDPHRLPRIDASLVNREVASDLAREEQQLQADIAEDWFQLARYYYAFGYFRAADYCFGVVDELTMGDASYLYFWAATLDRLGETASARQKYERAIQRQLEGVEPYAWLGIGNAWLRDEDEQRAEAAFRHEPASPVARYNLCRLLIRTGRVDEAVRNLDRLAAEIPGTIEADMMRSWAEEERGNWHAAEEFQARSLRRSKLLVTSGPAMVEAIERTESLPPSSWFFESLELYAAGRKRDAEKLAARSLQVQWIEEIARHLAALHLELGEVQKATEDLDEIERRVGVSAESLFLRGEVAEKTGDTAKALALWKQAVYFKSFAEGHEKLADSYAQLGDAALAQFHRGRGHFERGVLAWFANDLRTAEAEFERAVEANADDDQAWFYLADTRHAFADVDGARRAYQTCLQVNPDHGRALRGLQRLERATVKPSP